MKDLQGLPYEYRFCLLSARVYRNHLCKKCVRAFRQFAVQTVSRQLQSLWQSAFREVSLMMDLCPDSQCFTSILTAVTLLTTPTTVVAVGSSLLSGDARSSASLNFSSGTLIECRYATPRRKAESCVASLSISSSPLNKWATLLLIRIATSISSPKLSIASR